MVNGRLAVSTSLGDLILDSGASRLVLFGVEPDIGLGGKREWRTVAGSQEVGVISIKPLVIEGRTIWRGEAVAIPNRPAAAQFVQDNICLQFGRLRCFRVTVAVATRPRSRRTQF
jgi:hypothetical protein